MGTPLAVQGCTFKASVNPAVGTLSGGTIQAVSLPSQDIAVNSKGVYFDKISVTITGATLTLTSPVGMASISSSQPSPGSADIAGTAVNVLEGSAQTGKKAVLKGDSGTASQVVFMFAIVPTPPQPPFETPFPVDITIEVDDPGQTDVEAS